MSEETESAIRSLQDLAHAELLRQGPEAHLDPAVLSSYHAGELDEDRVAAVQEHLAVCLHCTRLLLDLPGFLAPLPTSALDPGGGGATEPGDPDAAANDRIWQEIRRQLPRPPASAATGPAPAAVAAPPDRPATQQQHPVEPTLPATAGRPAGDLAYQPPFWRPSLALAALASVAIAVSFLIVVRSALSNRQAATSILLTPPEIRRGTVAPTAPHLDTFHAGAPATLVLYLDDDLPGTGCCRASVLATGPAGEPLAAQARRPLDLVAQPIGPRTLLVQLAPHQLATGRYLLRVVDPRRPATGVLASYPLRVEDP